MGNHTIEERELLDFLRTMYEELIPFNQVLGLKVTHLHTDSVRTEFNVAPELIGNFVQRTLHGGVISSVLDATGGILATAGIIPRIAGQSEEVISGAFAKVGTIDLRVDYLRPGRGTRFVAKGTIMRTGKKVAVTRMELLNDEDVLIAVGTGTYLVG